MLYRLERVRDGAWKSSHLSIYPHKTLEAASDAGQYGYSVNNECVTIGDNDQCWTFPGNLGHYIRADLPPALRYNPPLEFKQMLLGQRPIPLQFECATEPKLAGWVDYAHPETGIVYSGMYNGGCFNYLDEFTVPDECAGQLVECLDRENVTLASNCAGLSPEELEDMDTIAKRTEFLFQVLGMRARATDKEINECLATEGEREKGIAYFGESNIFPELRDPLMLPPRGSVLF